MRAESLRASVVAVFVAVLTLTSVRVVALAAPSSAAAVEAPGTDVQLRAAGLMRECLVAVRNLRLSLGYAMDPDLDPNQTGIIGDEFTALTTSVADLKAKRTTADPAFAAALVRYFRRAGVSTGDVVAVGASGSYPGLVIATLCAVRALGLEPIIIVALGSSTYGANLPELAMTDMLVHLRREDLLPYELAAVSLGGANDAGRGVLFDGDDCALRAAALRSKATMIDEPTLASSIQRRLEIYARGARGRPIRCFVNVGAAGANYGYTAASGKVPDGLVTGLPVLPAEPDAGLIFTFLARGVPVIHLLNVRQLAAENNLPFDPIPLPPLPE